MHRSHARQLNLAPGSNIIRSDWVTHTRGGSCDRSRDLTSVAQRIPSGVSSARDYRIRNREDLIKCEGAGSVELVGMGLWFLCTSYAGVSGRSLLGEGLLWVEVEWERARGYERDMRASTRATACLAWRRRAGPRQENEAFRGIGLIPCQEGRRELGDLNGWFGLGLVTER